jgi:hypothetical protein
MKTYEAIEVELHVNLDLVIRWRRLLHAPDALPLVGLDLSGSLG